MHKQLFIVRHGSAPGANNGISDFDRTLDDYGIRDNINISEQLILQYDPPNRIISSAAVRALHSAMIYARAFNYPISEISIRDEIYSADKNIMLNIIKQTDNKIQNLLVCGHNPTFTELANHYLKEKIHNMPTSGVVCLKFNSESWYKIGRSNVISYGFYHP